MQGFFRPKILIFCAAHLIENTSQLPEKRFLLLAHLPFIIIEDAQTPMVEIEREFFNFADGIRKQAKLNISRHGESL